MTLILRIKKLHLHKQISMNKIIILTLSILILVSCSKTDNTTKAKVGTKEKNNLKTLSKERIQRILTTPINLKREQLDSVPSISIPTNYDTRVFFSDESYFEWKLADLDISTENNNLIQIELKSSFSNENMINENVLLVTNDTPDLLTIPRIKEFNLEETDSIYYEDSNSIIWKDYRSSHIIYYQYNREINTYTIYHGETLGFRDLTPLETEEITYYMLRNARNLHKAPIEQEGIIFDSWKDYVNRKPLVETNKFIKLFHSFPKEMKVFMDIDEFITPRSDGNYTYVSLYRSSIETDKKAMKLFEAIAQEDKEIITAFESGNTDISHHVISIYAQNTYTIFKEKNVYSIEEEKTAYDDSIIKSKLIICRITEGDKVFYIRAKNPDNPDFYIKMFNYFAAHKTLKVE